MVAGGDPSGKVGGGLRLQPDPDGFVVIGKRATNKTGIIVDSKLIETKIKKVIKNKVPTAATSETRTPSPSASPVLEDREAAADVAQDREAAPRDKDIPTFAEKDSDQEVPIDEAITLLTAASKEETQVARDSPMPIWEWLRCAENTTMCANNTTVDTTADPSAVPADTDAEELAREIMNEIEIPEEVVESAEVSKGGTKAVDMAALGLPIVGAWHSLVRFLDPPVPTKAKTSDDEVAEIDDLVKAELQPKTVAEEEQKDVVTPETVLVDSDESEVMEEMSVEVKKDETTEDQSAISTKVLTVSLATAAAAAVGGAVASKLQASEEEQKTKADVAKTREVPVEATLEVEKADDIAVTEKTDMSVVKETKDTSVLEKTDAVVEEMDASSVTEQGAPYAMVGKVVATSAFGIAAAASAIQKAVTGSAAKVDEEGVTENASVAAADGARSIPLETPVVAPSERLALLGTGLKSLPSIDDDVIGEESEKNADVMSKMDDDISVTKTPSMDQTSASLTAASMVEDKADGIKALPAKKGTAIKTEQLEKKADPTLNSRRNALIKELRSAISEFGRYDIRAANVSSVLGDLLKESGEDENAIKLHRDAVSIYSCKLGDDHTSTLESKVKLGNILEKSKKYDEAIETYSNVTAMRRSLNGDNDPSVADGLVNIAHALRESGDYLQAIRENKKALKIYRETLGDSHDKVASTVDEIASLYTVTGDFVKSAAILEEVVKLKAATQGVRSPQVADTLGNLATTYECAENYTQALKTLKKAYKIHTEVGGYSSESSTSTLGRIAELYEATSDHHRASIAYLGVLRGRKVNYGSEHLKVGDGYYRLGRSLRNSEQHEKALRCMKEALPIFVGKGSEMKDVDMISEIMHEMGLINKANKNFYDAARIFRQELRVRRKVGQPEFPLCARALNHLGVTEFEQKNHSRALKYLIEAMGIMQDAGEQGLQTAEILFNTGLVFEAVRNKDRAVEAFSEAARIFSEHGYDENHPHMVRANHKILKNGKPGDSGSINSKSRSPIVIEKKRSWSKGGIKRFFK